MKQYFYIDSNNQQIGPISEEAVIALLKCGAISRQTLIWAEGMPGWQPVCAVFPNVVEEIAPANAPEPTAATIAREPRRSRRKSRNPLIIGGAVALIAAFSFTAYFVSDSGDSSSPVSATAKKKRFKPRKNSKEKAVKELRELGVISSELDIQSGVGSRAMAHACAQGNINITELLLAGGINVAQMNDYDVLLGAAKNGHPEIVKLLLAVPGIDVNKECKDWHISVDDHRSTPLERAAKNGHTEVVRLLLAIPGIEVNKHCPLMFAARNGHAEVVKLLLAAPGIDVNLGSPLAEAIENKHTEVVRLLLVAPGIDVNLGALLAEAAMNGHVEVVKLLLAVPGIKYDNALYYAAKHGHVEIVKLLLAAPGIVVTWEHLAVAKENGHTEIVKLLRAAGARE